MLFVSQRGDRKSGIHTCTPRRNIKEGKKGRRGGGPGCLVNHSILHAPWPPLQFVFVSRVTIPSFLAVTTFLLCLLFSTTMDVSTIHNSIIHGAQWAWVLSRHDTNCCGCKDAQQKVRAGKCVVLPFYSRYIHTILVHVEYYSITDYCPTLHE